MAPKKGTLTIRVVSDTDDLEKGLDETEKRVARFTGNLAPTLKAGAAAGGLAAGAALTSGFFTALDQQATTARLGASLGLPEEEARKLGKTAGRLYTKGFGQSFEDVAGAVESVASTIGDELDPDLIEPLTEKALNLATVFELDVGQAVSAVGYLIETGLAKDATEAFDLITVALQKLPREMRGEALDALSEYAGAFAALGFEGEEAIRLILDTADETSVGIDKVGDAIKEFLIRSTDGSTLTSEALATLGLDAGKISNAILEGGDSAEWAFGKIIEGLLSIEDPSERAQTAVALFGTPIEDLNVNKIPAFLTALQEASGGLEGVEGAADRVGDSMDTNATKVEAFKRTVEQSIVNFLADDVIPALENLDENWELTWRLITDSGAEAAEEIIGYLGDVRDAFQGPIDGALDLLELLSDISGIDTSDVADAVGVDRSEHVLLPPAEFERRQRLREAPTRGPLRQFHEGGVFHAPPGQREGLARLRDGERVLTPEQDRARMRQQSSTGTVNHNDITINLNGGDHDASSLASTLAWHLGGFR